MCQSFKNDLGLLGEVYGKGIDKLIHGLGPKPDLVHFGIDAVKRAYLSGYYHKDGFFNEELVRTSMFKDIEEFNRLNRDIRPRYSEHILDSESLLLEQYGKGNTTPFDEFMNVSSNGAVFIQVKKIEEYSGFMISDITVDSNNHTFVANGFLSHNSSMVKQSIGIPTSNHTERYDTISHSLYYPQKPLVTSIIQDKMQFKNLPSGINTIVAIMCYTGYNQEDSLIFNKGSVERGLHRSIYTKVSTDSEKSTKTNGKNETFTKNTDQKVVRGLVTGNYEKLDSDGFPYIGSKIIENDVIIGKISPLVQDSLPVAGQTQTYRDSSTSVRYSEAGTVDKVLLSSNSDGNRFVKVRICSSRTPQMGDKFASRSAQKGSLGLLLKDSDMPFTEDGIVPDIIMNPHAIPSRMTNGHLIEMLMGNLAVEMGIEGNALPFINNEHNTIEKISDSLKLLGLEDYGQVNLTNGFTGEQMPAKVFMGPIYYQRLKHMVKDKIHCLDTYHQVLTISGWKSCDQLSLEDKVACMDENRQLVYKNPIKGLCIMCLTNQRESTL
jgi:DNA-directed RNA polymerase beta subunit